MEPLARSTPASRTMQRIQAALKQHALAYPEAWEDHPWGGVVIKVRKKIFCSFGDGDLAAGRLCLSVKLPHSEAQALDLPGAEPTHYGLGKHSWVTLNLESEDLPDGELLKAYIDESYRAIAPKTLVRQLEA